MMFTFWVFSFKKKKLLSGLICVVDSVTAIRDGAAMLLTAGYGFIFNLRLIHLNLMCT